MKIRLRNAQNAVAFDLPAARSAAAAAWERCRHLGKGRPTPIEATIVDNATISRVHAEFFNDPSPTDVITFPYGEILLGAETIAENARHFHQPPTRELVRCLVHGMLHLRGYDDRTPKLRRAMERVQEEILGSVFPEAPGAPPC